MGLDDFDKIKIESDTDKKNSKKFVDDDLSLESIEYYLSHIDELIDCVMKSYVNYINAKMRYDFKKNNFQTSINWTDENALRVNNGLPKVTTQDQRNSVIELKVKSLKIDKESCEMEYKMYNKIFDFISKNFELLSKSCCNCDEVKELLENFEE